ncbi:MAG: hypothetical protein JW715_00960 [Sedimentisphaerales bacterium]|nr:hypothetical protein [Sedimentisphaerales bacterium]
MNPWLEIFGIILIITLSVMIGRSFSGLRRPYWMFGYFLPCILIAVLVAARFYNDFYFIRPFSWITAGRFRYVILSMAVSMGLSVLVPRLPRRWEKVVVCILLLVFVTWSSIVPFLAPALIKGRLANLTTRFDENGICRQTTDYTCGPAAAVTALGKLGLSADEGEIAVLSHTSPIAGTLPALLCAALEDRYSADGLKCKYRRFDSIEQLRKAGVTLAVVKDAFLVDHCLVVLEVLDNAVAVADPVTGVEIMPYEKFEKIWRFSGIVLERNSAQNI